jgi:hypothetical protein
MGAGTGAALVSLCRCAPQHGIEESANMMATHPIADLFILVMAPLSNSNLKNKIW